jgi:flagellar hook-basal body complex protein FliE
MEIYKSPSTLDSFGPNKLSKNQNKEISQSSFGSMLKKAISEVNELHLRADQSVDDLSKGKEIDIHKTIIALEKADVSFRLMMQIRNKAVEAYQEIMRIQV